MTVTGKQSRGGAETMVCSPTTSYMMTAAQQERDSLYSKHVVSANCDRLLFVCLGMLESSSVSELSGLR